MRIRKNKKLSALIYPQGKTVHICRLNQSTWDVNLLPEEAYRFEFEDSFDRIGNIGDSIGVIESVATMMESKEEPIMKVGGIVNDINGDNEDNESNQEALLKSCSNKEARNYDNRLIGGGRERSRATRRKGSSLASISNEFYYYSGFRPSRGRRRHDGDNVNKIGDNLMVENNNGGSVITAQNNLSVSCSSLFDNFDEEQVDEENVVSGKKRIKKPIKERSSKSLM